MADSINNKAKEYYDNDNTGGSLNNNLKDFLKQQGAEGNSLNTLWRNYAYGEGGNSLNTRLGKLWGTSGSLIKRWKDVLGLTWDDLKLFFNARRNDPELLLSGATSFDTDDYINTGTPFSNTNHTISAWVNASATGGVVFDNRDANDDGIRLIYDSSLIYQLNSSDVSLSSPSLNTWHHIACTYDGTTQKLYLNGSLVASASTSQTISVSQNLIIGKQSYSDVAYFNGSMANVGIWNRALSASEIESIYWRGQYADLKGTELTNLVSWYNLSANANDSTGTNNGTNNGATFLTDAYSASSPFLPRIQDKATPKGAVALASGSTSFTTDDYISLPSLASTIGNGALTFAGWFKTNTLADYYVLYIGTPSSNANYIILKINSNGTILTQARLSGTVSLTSTATITAGNWHHIAVTRSGTTGTLYVDGTSVTSTDSNWGVTVGSETTLGAFRIASNSGFYTGSMANVAIYSDAKTQSQIQDIMFSSYSTLTSELKTNLVSWYDLGTNVEDSHGSNDGTNNGATINTGYTNSPSGVADPLNYGEVYGGNAVSFDGINDFINLGDGADLSFGDDTNDFPFTFSAWVNADDLSDFPIIAKGVYNSTAEYSWMFNGSDQLRLEIYDDSNSTYESARTDALTSFQGKWTHCVVTYDGRGGTSANQGIALYINGLAQSLTLAGAGTYGAMKDKGADAYIGRNNTTYGDGKINNVKIFNTALTQDQVRELYTKPELTLPTGVSSSALKLDMPMQEGSGTAILDGSGNQNHGTGSGITWATGQEYGFQHPLVRSNNPMVFDGSDDYVDTGSAFQSTLRNNFSWSTWVNVTDGDEGNYQVLFGARNADESDWIQADLYNGTIRFIYKANGNTIVSTSSAVLSNGQTGWKYLTFTADGSNMVTYLNGSAIKTTSMSGVTMSEYTSSDEIWIGARDNNNTGQLFYDGMINDVAIWGSALTANEVTALYNSGLPLLPTADSGNYASAADLVGYWRNDGVTTWIDRSTNSNNGTVAGSPASIIVPEGLNEGRDSQGYYLTDTDSISSGIRFKGAEYISVQDSESLSFGNGTSDLPFSLEAWIKPNDVTNFEVFAKGIYNSTGEYLFGFEADDKLKFYLFDESVASTTEGVLYNTALTSSEGQWMHIVGTYDGRGGTSANAGMKIYLNGSQVNNGTESAGTYVAMENLSANLEIGKYSSNYAKGSIDEAKVYSKELSASEVLKNYNNGKSAHSN